jgi:Alcohol dehydrogenase GroES-like domain
MRQIWISKAGPPEVLVVKEAPDPQPAAGEMRLRVEASGVNFADILGRLGLYPDLPRIPVVPGYEVAGRVDGVGGRLDPSWVGRDVFALTRFGGYADVVCVPKAQVFPRQGRAGSTIRLCRLVGGGQAVPCLDALPLQNEFVSNPALALQSEASPFFSEFDNLDADVDHVADLDRTQKVQGLGDVDRPRARQSHADDRRNEARRVQSVDNPTAESRLPREVLGQMNWIPVARELRESNDILILDRLADRLTHTDREVLEMEGLNRGLLHTFQAFFVRSVLAAGVWAFCGRRFPNLSIF